MVYRNNISAEISGICGRFVFPLIAQIYAETNQRKSARFAGDVFPRIAQIYADFKKDWLN
jgi:hypothetical protein